MRPRHGRILPALTVCLLALTSAQPEPPLPGDVDGDCDVDLIDREVFVDVLLGNESDPGNITRADHNGDGQRDGEDVQPFSEALIGAPPGGSVPQCASVNSSYMTLAYCGGAQYVPNLPPEPTEAFSTYGIVAVDLPDTVLLEGGGTFWISVDSGCTWTALASLAQGEQWPLVLVRAAGGGAYAWSLTDETLYQLRVVEQTQDELCCPSAPIEAVGRPSPAQEIVGLGTDPVDPLRVLVADDEGQLYESTNGGANWLPIGTPPPVGPPTTYRVAFNPADPYHAILGRSQDGAWVTFDGGVTWTQSSGFTDSDGWIFAYNMSISPVDSNVVWAMALDWEQHLAGHPSDGRHIFRSTNGGLDFTSVLDQGPGIVINNGPELILHPTDPYIVSFIFNSNISGAHIYRFDVSTGHVITYDHPAIGMRMFEYSRNDPSIVFFGLDHNPG